MGSTDSGKSVGAERRVSQRYLIADRAFEAGHVVLVGGAVHSLQDISYGGFSASQTARSTRSAESDDTAAVLEPGMVTPVELHLLGAAKTGQSTLVFSGSKGLGFAFNHETTVLLTFLRRILEPMRLGTQLRPMRTENLSDRYRSGDWHVFQGEGPTDVLLRMEQGSIVEALVTFRQKQHYLSVAFTDGKFQTNVSQDAQGLGTRMASTGQLDQETLRKAASILIGLLQSSDKPWADAVARLVDSMKAHLEGCVPTSS